MTGQPDATSDPVDGELTVPVGEVSAVDMLPAFRAYTEAMVAQAIAFSTAPGQTALLAGRVRVERFVARLRGLR